jgi:hypothetical protein
MSIHKAALFGAGSLTGLAIAVLLIGPWGAPDARAGVCRGNTGDYVSSDASGRQIYVWSFATNPPKVYAYDFDAGTYTHKDLSLPRKKVVEPTKKEKGEAKEVNISGTIWTPEPSERVAIINGKTYREGEVFQTKSGKRYKIIEIKPTNEVLYKEVE